MNVETALSLARIESWRRWQSGSAGGMLAYRAAVRAKESDHCSVAYLVARLDGWQHPCMGVLRRHIFDGGWLA